MEGLEALFYTYCRISLLKVLENNLYFDIALDGLHTGFNIAAAVRNQDKGNGKDKNNDACSIKIKLELFSLKLALNCRLYKCSKE